MDVYRGPFAMSMDIAVEMLVGVAQILAQRDTRIQGTERMLNQAQLGRPRR